MSNDRPLFKITGNAPPSFGFECHFISQDRAKAEWRKVVEAMKIDGAVEIEDDFGTSMLVRPREWILLFLQDFAMAFEGHSEFQRAGARWSRKMDAKAEAEAKQDGVAPRIIQPGPGVRLPG